LEYLRTKYGIEYDVARQENLGKLVLSDIKKMIKSNTYMVICNHISNVNGDKADIEEIGKFCHENNILFLVDGAQSGGHEYIDMKKNNIDFLSLAGHKGFYSMQGIGVLIAQKLDALSPIKFGGTGTNSLELVQPEISPERFEVGTLPSQNIISLGAGIDFVTSHEQVIKEKLDDLTTFLNYSLSSLPVKIYTMPFNAHGVLAYNIENIHSNEITSYLDERWNICVRGGYHCAPKKHEALGTIEQGAIRVSMSYFNSIYDIQHLVNATKTYLRKNKIF
jgi:selenocysteine lyase/cysteine desulfurase